MYSLRSPRLSTGGSPHPIPLSPRLGDYSRSTSLPLQKERHGGETVSSVIRKVTRIYLAAPLFSEAERTFNCHLRDLLQSDDVDVYLPQEQGEGCSQGKSEERAQLFAAHVKALQNADVVVAVCDGPDTDSGTAWEMGYAAARGTRVIALRTDVRMAGTGTRVNLMLALAADVVTDTGQLLSLLHRSLAAS